MGTATADRGGLPSFAAVPGGHKEANLFRMFFVKLPQNRHPERSASQMDRMTQRLGCGVEEPVTFSTFGVFCIFHQLYSPPRQIVILSEALCRSISNRELYGAESKDLGDACSQMLLGAFRPQATTQDKKVTGSERSASQMDRVTQRLWRGVEGPRWW